MAQSFLLIDGYNLMHAAGMARQRYGPGDLERCRTQFLKFLLSTLKPAELQRATVVFDAGNSPYDNQRHSKLAGMSILYSPRNSDADTVIEQLIADHSAPKQIHVVSSDHRLQKAARRRRASFVDSEEFAARLERRNLDAQGMGADRSPKRHDDAKYTGKLTEDQTQEWLKTFGETEHSEIPPENSGARSSGSESPLEDPKLPPATVSKPSDEFDRIDEESEQWQAYIDGLPENIEDWDE